MKLDRHMWTLWQCILDQLFSSSMAIFYWNLGQWYDDSMEFNWLWSPLEQQLLKKPTMDGKFGFQNADIQYMAPNSDVQGHSLQCLPKMWKLPELNRIHPL